MSEEKGESHHQKHHDHPPPPPYGTFQGVANHPPPPAMGFPQPVPPPGVSGAPPPHYYAHGYQAVPGYAAVATGRPVTVREHRLPCCGIGFGWFCFIIGFFLAAIPWYIAAFLLLCSRIDPREKPGYVACTIALFASLPCSYFLSGSSLSSCIRSAIKRG